MSFLQTHLQVSVTIINAFRLGKKSAKPRLFKISLSNVEEKIAILKRKIKLRSSAIPESVRNFISPQTSWAEKEHGPETTISWT